MIELNNIDKHFRDIHAVDHITASIQEGMIFGLAGSNGAGKSTLLRMISGILRPSGWYKEKLPDNPRILPDSSTDASFRQRPL